MMEQLANKGNGNYFYMDSFAEARKIFEKDLFANVETVAKDSKIQSSSTRQCKRIQARRIRQSRLNKEDFNNDAVDAGE